MTPVVHPVEVKQARQSRSTKKPKLPNGFGRITKLKGKLRNPYRAMITVGTNEFGQPIGKLLKPKSYFPSYNEAYQALMKYHDNPADYGAIVTMNEMYERWYEVHSKKVSDARNKTIKNCWEYCREIYQIPVQEFRIRDAKNVIENGYRYRSDYSKIVVPPTIKPNIKMVLSAILDYAIECEILSHNCVKDIKSSYVEGETKHHMSFTEREMNVIKKHKNDSLTHKLIYIQCYSGLRPMEMLSLESGKLNMENWSITCGLKTEAGKNRILPIHENIRTFISEFYKESLLSPRSKGCLIVDKGESLSYATYKYRFNKVMKELNLEPGHAPHDCRKQFITMGKRAGMDEYALKRIVGHAISDITESVYTDRDVEWLHKELKKIP